MSAVLGVSCHHHDAAAALVVDGRLVAAVAEERLSRVKHDPRLPRRAIRHVLASAGISGAELDRVVFHENPYEKLERILVHGLRTFPRSFFAFPGAVADQLTSGIWVLDALAAATGVPRERVTHGSHHRSHAASALFTSPWSDAAILTVDGVGTWATTTLSEGRDGVVTELDRTLFPHSLGLLYAGITGWLGFRVNEGEYKVMGLAAYGEPRLRAAFARLLQLGPRGAITLDPAPFGHFCDPARGFGGGLEALLGPARRPGRPWDLSTTTDRSYADVAATLQAVTEEALLALAGELHRRTGCAHLCLAGGVALNAVANRRLAAESPFEAVYVHPAAGDAGAAVGAALLGAQELGDVVRASSDPFLGPEASAERALAVARELGFSAGVVDDPDVGIARELSAGKIVARCSGRCEWGPRALGNRSILASPTDSGVRDHLNRVVKRREPFRPFAPAVAEGAFGGWFEGVPDPMTAVMTTTRAVLRPEELPATTHVDGSARVQSVSSDGPLAPILAALEGPPVVLNTSLNGPGEPICGSEVDALGFFLRHPVDALYVGDVRITR